MTLFHNNIVDGIDTAQNAMFATYGGSSEQIYNNYYRYVSGALVGAANIVHDNTVEYPVYSFDGNHANGIFNFGPASGNYTLMYGNVVRHWEYCAGCVAFWTNGNDTPNAGWIAYVFNNVLYDINGNVINLGGHAQTPTVGMGTYYLFNNTVMCGDDSFYGGCPGSNPTSPPYNNMTTYDYNNHWISQESTVDYCGQGVPGGGACFGGTYPPDLNENLSQASAQGYMETQTNVFSPVSGCTSATCGTVQNGNNLQSLCAAVAAINVAAGTACQQSTTFGVGYNTTKHTVIAPALATVARPSNGAWDIGAYQYCPPGQCATPPLTIQTTSLPSGTVGTAYNQTLTASGGTAPYSWSIVRGSLPAGLTSVSGAISGTPTTAATSNFTVQAQDSATPTPATATQAFSITVTASPPPGTVATPTISPPGGSFTGSQSVMLNEMTPGAAVYYTTDGTTPTTSSLLYESPFTITQTTTVNAIAYASGLTPSSVASAVFTLSNAGAGGGSSLPAIDPNDLPGSVGINDSLSITNYPDSNVSFVWSFGPVAINSTATPSVIARAATASFTSGVKTSSLASYGLQTGTYQVSVYAMDSQSHVSNTLTKTITLVNADLSAVKVYPNPWRSDKHAGKSVTFSGLTTGTTIKLFTISGHEVRELNTDGPSTTWDLTNDSGDRVGSGIYLYVITDSQSDKVRGKLAVIK